MRQTLTLPTELYQKLARGAAERGLTIEDLLSFISDLMVVPDRPTKKQRERNHRIETLLIRYRSGPLTVADRNELDQLIGDDYQAANARADKLISRSRSNSKTVGSKTLRK